MADVAVQQSYDSGLAVDTSTMFSSGPPGGDLNPTTSSTTPQGESLTSLAEGAAHTTRQRSPGEYPSPSVVAADQGAGPFYSGGHNPVVEGSGHVALDPNTIPQLTSDVSGVSEPDIGAAAIAAMNEVNRVEEDISQMEGGEQDPVFGGPIDGNDSITPRKRSKVSRACDECRRKKVYNMSLK
jgi:hypothetical protein